VETLERENTQLKQRIRELETLKDRSDIENYKQSKQVRPPRLVTTLEPTTCDVCATTA